MVRCKGKFLFREFANFFNRVVLLGVQREVEQDVGMMEESPGVGPHGATPPSQQPGQAPPTGAATEAGDVGGAEGVTGETVMAMAMPTHHEDDLCR